MMIFPIGYNSGVTFCRADTLGKTASKSIELKAQEELKRITNSPHAAGDKNAWWRNEYNDAVSALKNFCEGDLTKETIPAPLKEDGSINLKFFRDEFDDGLI